MTDPDSPAYPNHELGKSHFGDPGAYPGLTIRAHLAAMAMHGILSNPTAKDGLNENGRELAAIFAVAAICCADALIAELEEAVRVLADSVAWWTRWLGDDLPESSQCRVDSVAANPIARAAVEKARNK